MVCGEPRNNGLFDRLTRDLLVLERLSVLDRLRRLERAILLDFLNDLERFFKLLTDFLELTTIY